MHLTATHINYYHVCHRKLWLFSHGIRMEHNSEIVAEGKLTGETSYADRAEKYTEVQLDNIKIDYYDARNKVVHEIKKSDKVEHAHIAQVKYYLWVLERHGIEGVRGIIEYPRLRHTTPVELTEEDRRQIPHWEAEVRQILRAKACPPPIHKKICRSCSYHDFCYAGDE